MRQSTRLLTPLAVLLAGGAALAQDAGVRTEELGDGLHVLFAPGSGNMLVSIGESGVLMVDDGVPDVVDAYRSEIIALGGGAVDFVINTHWHYDHADGNKTLGPDGTRLISHGNSRTMMMRDNVIDLGTGRTIDQPAYPAAAWPVLTYDESMEMHFNGERIRLMHSGPAHTNGDTAVIFTDRNIVHMGDVFITVGYPFVDADHGGSLIGIVEFCEAVLDALEPGATVVPGHGEVTDAAALAEYAATLRTVYERISALVDDGATLEQVIAAEPTADFDDAMGDPAGVINRTYASLTR